MIGMTDAALDLCGGHLPEHIYYGIKKIVTDLAYHEFTLIDGVVETLEALEGHFNLVVATKGDVTEQMFKYRRSGLDRYFHHCEVMENKDEKNYLELAAKHNLEPEKLLMIGNSVKSDIAPVVNVGGWAIHTPHDVVWVHEMMDMPESDRIIEVENIREVVKYLL
jgi:putative hydrolase of the HAD superfamily